MTKEEIIAGLKNAVENGSSLEQAKASFLNSGYNPKEVEQAAREISAGVLHPVQKLPQMSTQSKQPLEENQEKKPFAQKIPLIGKLFNKKEHLT